MQHSPNSIGALDSDPNSEVVTWLQYIGQKFTKIESIHLFKRTNAGSEYKLCAGVVLSNICRLGDRQSMKKELVQIGESHGMGVLGLTELIVLDEISEPLVSDVGFRVYQRKD